MLMSSSGPLIRVVNINYGDIIVSFQWSWFYEEEGITFGEPCDFVDQLSFGSNVGLGYVTAFTFDGDNTSFPAEYEIITEPETPTTSVGFPSLTWETVHMSDESASISPFVQEGQGAGSAEVPLFGVKLNGVLGCYGLELGSPNGTIGILKDPLVQPPYQDTGSTVGFAWPNIRVRTPDGAEWDTNTYTFGAFFKIATLTVTFRSQDQ